MEIAALDVWVVISVAKLWELHENRGVTKWSDRDQKRPQMLAVAIAERRLRHSRLPEHARVVWDGDSGRVKKTHCISMDRESYKIQG